MHWEKVSYPFQKSLLCLRKGYTRQVLISDLIAGVTVGLVALPLAMAFGIVATHGVSGLLIVTIMAGIILMLMAVTGLGSAVKYIPRPVTIGFTNGCRLDRFDTDQRLAGSGEKIRRPSRRCQGINERFS